MDDDDDVALVVPLRWPEDLEIDEERSPAREDDLLATPNPPAPPRVPLLLCLLANSFFWTAGSIFFLSCKMETISPKSW